MYDNPIPTRFLAHRDFSKIQALYITRWRPTRTDQLDQSHQTYPINMNYFPSLFVTLLEMKYITYLSGDVSQRRGKGQEAHADNHWFYFYTPPQKDVNATEN